MLKKYKESINNFETVLKLNPKDFNNGDYYNLTEAYIFDNQIDKAIISLTKYLKDKDCFIWDDDIQVWKDEVGKSTATPEQKEEINKLIDKLSANTKQRPD